MCVACGEMPGGGAAAMDDAEDAGGPRPARPDVWSELVCNSLTNV